MMNPIPHGLTGGKRYTFRPDCDECCVEALERMTFGGVVTRYDDIIPDNIYTEIGGERVSYPYVAR